MNEYNEMVDFLVTSLDKELNKIPPTNDEKLIVKARTLVNFIKTNGNRRFPTKLS